MRFSFFLLLATLAWGQQPPPAAPAAAPGWLPAPGGAPDVVRYWDGSAWTEHTARRA